MHKIEFSFRRQTKALQTSPHVWSVIINDSVWLKYRRNYFHLSLHVFSRVDPCFGHANIPADTPILVCRQLSSDSPQLSVQCLDHGRKAPTGLVQIDVAGPQAVAHVLLAGETKEGRLSVEACGSDRATGSGGLLQAPLPAPPPALQEGSRGSGAAAPRRHRERAL